METFRDMDRDGIDVHRPLLWVYTFLNKDVDRLEEVAHELEQMGYTPDTITEALDDQGEPTGHYLLSITEFAEHTAQSLHERNQLFYAYATQTGLGMYYGFDCTPDVADF
ncbi:MAG TPA: ribonuclease E inhibitor RraB [Anaerolineales bacterium]|nr:ribonuclease E inhibitor RraB [Anaerolineales bacterium]